MLHEETRAQWEQYTPQSFVDRVLNGALRDKIRLTSTVIHVYTQIMFRIPEADSTLLTATLPGDLPGTSIRDAFITMRWNAAEMVDVIECGSVTLPARYTPAMYISSVIRGLKQYVVTIHQCASALHADPAVQSLGRTMPNGRTTREVAAEILDHTAEIMRYLNFAQYYVDRLKSCV
ncbi:MAG: hypothetical protein HZC41_04290 [Chloroflexi bacterium]|nr:hypothetical protein [Chloroflexota bacterium]